jgi:hypothetical protein
MKNRRSLLACLFLFTALIAAPADAYEVEKIGQISGTSYARFLDGTVLAQYNFADEVVAVQTTHPRRQATESRGAAVDADVNTRASALMSVYVTDYRGALLWTTGGVSSTDLERTLQQFRGQLVVVSTVDTDGRRQCRLYW